MLAILLSKADERLLGALLFQKCKDFTVYLPQESPLMADYEGRLSLKVGSLEAVTEELLCMLEADSLPDQDWVRRILRTAGRHPEFDVYHVNPTQGKAWPRKMSATKLFLKHEQEGLPVPLSSFIFRTAKLRAAGAFRPDGTLLTLQTVLACAKEMPVRNVWRQHLAVTQPVPETDPVLLEKEIREKIDFYRWSETFFGEEYPLSTGKRLALFAGTVSRLYPSYPVEDLKEIMAGFRCAQSTIGKIRSSSALKSALKQRTSLMQ